MRTTKFEEFVQSICKPRGVVPTGEEWARMHELRADHVCFAIVLTRVGKQRYVQIVPEREDRHGYARMLNVQLRLGNAVLYCGYYKPETIEFVEEDFSPQKRLRVWTMFYADHPKVMEALSRARESAERADASLYHYETRTRRNGEEYEVTVHHTTLNSYWDAAGVMLEKGRAFSDAAMKSEVRPDSRTVTDYQERMRVLSLASWKDDYQAIVPMSARPAQVQASDCKPYERKPEVWSAPIPVDKYKATDYPEPSSENRFRRRCPNHGFQRTDRANRVMSWMGCVGVRP